MELNIKCIYCEHIISRTFAEAYELDGKDFEDRKCAHCNAAFEIATNGEKVFFSWSILMDEGRSYLAEYYFNAETGYIGFDIFEDLVPHNDRVVLGRSLYHSNHQLNIKQIKAILNNQAFL